ncbi:MAG TPA: hypothetical protein VN203_07925 [Candidatus Acidoferrum sp.]|nr:hypothetical protein [Candidatus Acidoferrum sp.]
MGKLNRQKKPSRRLSREQISSTGKERSAQARACLSLWMLADTSWILLDSSALGSVAANVDAKRV